MTDQLPRRYVGIDTVDANPDEAVAHPLPAYAARLRDELAARVEGEVRFDNGSRAAYSTDSSNYRQVPIGVVVPKSVDDVMATVELCRKYGAPITSRGGGTSLAGQTCNVAIVIDYSKYMNRVLSIDAEAKRAVVEPGCNLDVLRETAKQHGLTFGPDPATHSRNTIGGMIGNNSCGVHSVMAEFYGPGPLTVHQTIELDVVTYDGERMIVGATSDEAYADIVNAGERRAEIYSGLRGLRDEHAERIRKNYPQIPRRVSGYNLDWLLAENGFHVARALVGSEGTCVMVLSATLELIDAKPERALVALGYLDAYHAGDHVPEIMKHRPVGLEGLDQELIGYMKKKGLHPDDVDLLPEGEGWLLVEFGADTKAEAEAQAQTLIDSFDGVDDAPSTKLFTDEWEEQKLWTVRESGLGASAHVPGMAMSHPGWEDAAVPPEAVGRYLRDFRDLLDEFGYHAALYGHFGQGCIHCRIDFDLSTTHGVTQWMEFLDRAADLVVSHGGSLSGEHGDGQARAALLVKMFGPELVEAFGRFKHIWDPDGRMNPGKVVDPYRPDENLRMGPDDVPVQLKTHFAFPDDNGSFANALDRCVGVGACRDVESGGMCPSYMATREEEDSTRGRARLLWEMLRGDVIADGWRDPHVAEALDLCLACKACKNECPVNVDMATYKAEFLSHFYKRRLRPAEAYALGLIYWWARIASKVPRVVNFVGRTKPTSTIIKKLGGVAQERTIPPFASPTFRSWFEQRSTSPARSRGHGPGSGGDSGPRSGQLAEATLTHAEVPRFQRETYAHGSDRHRSGTLPGSSLNPHGDDAPFETTRVVLWPDTFNNYLMTHAAKAAVEVLEDAGYTVEIPNRPLCCGRPLYDWGMLDTAEKLWHQTLETLRPYLRAGVPIVGLEPSCVASFRDELINLFPNDTDAKRLSEQTFEFSEFLVRQRYEPPRLERKALVHGHCHHKAIMHMDAEVAMLKAMGLDYEVPDAGCCGMAGSFGFGADHYEVSTRVGERVLLPRVRDAADDTFIIANGFSCREQVSQLTGRRGLHLAEVIAIALRDGVAGPPSGRPEDTVEI